MKYDKITDSLSTDQYINSHRQKLSDLGVRERERERGWGGGEGAETFLPQKITQYARVEIGVNKSYILKACILNDLYQQSQLI